MFPNGNRRLALAQAIVDPENPLLRRVIVNWVWQHHFGLGLVRTPDDFGIRSQPPTHPELLDYLAATFTEDGWSLKKLHRRILLSRAYAGRPRWKIRTAARIDPENALVVADAASASGHGSDAGCHAGRLWRIGCEPDRRPAV